MRCAIAADTSECAETSPVEISVESEKGETRVFTGTVNAIRWQDVAVDLAAFENKDVKLVFRVKPARFSACGAYYWADPILISAKGS